MPPVVYEIEKGAIEKVALAIGDPNPLWQDEEFGKKNKYGSIIVQPTFLAALLLDKTHVTMLGMECPLKWVLNAGDGFWIPPAHSAR